MITPEKENEIRGAIRVLAKEGKELEKLQKHWDQGREELFKTWEFEGKKVIMTQMAHAAFARLKVLFDEGKLTLKEVSEYEIEFIARIQMARKMFKCAKPGQERARAFHRLIDIAIIAHKEMDARSKDIKCKKGCSNCCYQKVTLTEDEADLLKDRLSEADKEIIREQASWEDDPNIWSSHFPRSKCVFLKDNTCSVYEDRPMACRTLFTISDPKACDVRANMSTENFTVPNVEFLVSGVWIESKLDNLAKTLARMIE